MHTSMRAGVLIHSSGGAYVIWFADWMGSHASAYFHHVERHSQLMTDCIPAHVPAEPYPPSSQIQEA